MTGKAMEGFEEILAENSSVPKELLRDMLQLHEIGKSYRKKQREINEIISRILYGSKCFMSPEFNVGIVPYADAYLQIYCSCILNKFEYEENVSNFGDYWKLYRSYCDRVRVRVAPNEDSDAVIESKKIYNELKRKRGDFIQKVKTYFERNLPTITAAEVNGSLTESGQSVPETSPEEDWDVLSVFDCDQNTIPCIQPRLKRLRSATKAVNLSPIPTRKRKRKRCIAGNAKKSRIIKRRRARRFSSDTTNNLESTNGDSDSCSDVLTYMKSMISRLNVLTKQDLIKYLILDSNAFCANCQASMIPVQPEGIEGTDFECANSNCSCKKFKQANYHENGFYVRRVLQEDLDLEYVPRFFQPVTSSMRGRKGQLCLRNLRPVNFGRKKNDQHRYMLSWDLVPDPEDKRYIDQILRVLEMHVDNFMTVNNEQFKQNADRILGPRIYRNMDGSMRRDAVLLVSLPGNEVQSHHTDQKCRNDGLSVIYALQDNTYLDVVIGSHVSDVWRSSPQPYTRVHIPRNHYILFSGGLYHCGINYDDFNTRVHMYVDFFGSHRTPGFVFNKEVSARTQSDEGIAAIGVNKRTLKRYYPYHKRQMNMCK